ISGATVIVRIRLRIRVVWPLVVPVRIIIIARWIGITIARKSKTDSANAGKAGGDLSVSALRGNESYSAYRQCNQEKFLYRICLLPRRQRSAEIPSRSRPSEQHRPAPKATQPCGREAEGADGKKRARRIPFSGLQRASDAARRPFCLYARPVPVFQQPPKGRF